MFINISHIHRHVKYICLLFSPYLVNYYYYFISFLDFIFIYSILILDFYQAFRYNPLLFIMLPIFVFFIINSIVTKKEPLYNKIPKQILYTFIFILIIYGILRNVPLFDFLAPTFIG